jgi:hypothetical protein
MVFAGLSILMGRMVPHFVLPARSAAPQKGVEIAIDSIIMVYTQRMRGGQP